eukprot:GHVU01136244.1.p2 GENE.GHVU01136244.1~~GHVU01136244.1.p2  ORF type:complete len:142 (+),score=15.51 GHVU01136244.1:55-426(+)
MAAQRHADEFTVEGLGEFRWNGVTKRFEVYVKWDGFEDDESTWEPVSVIAVDVPSIMYERLRTSGTEIENEAYENARLALPKKYRDRLPGRSTSIKGKPSKRGTSREAVRAPDGAPGVPRPRR